MKYKAGYATEFVAEINKSNDKFILTKESRPINTLKEMLETSTHLFGNNTAFHQKFKGDKEYTQITYNEVLSDVNALGTALIAHGMKDKRIAIVGENSYYWAMSYLATACGTGIVVPIDKELSDADIKGLIEKSEASCVIFSPKYRKIFKTSSECSGEQLAGSAVKDGSGEEVDTKSPASTDLLLIELSGEYAKDGGAEASLSAETPTPIAAASPDSDGICKLTDMIAEGKQLVSDGDTRFINAEIDTEVMSVLLFTSGTTGASKGVMLSQRNLCSDLMSAPNLLTVLETDLFFSILPIHHTYECTCGLLMPLYKGAAIGYCEGLKYIQKNLKELQPTMFLGVPLIFEKLYNSIWKNIRKQGKEVTVKKVLKLSKALSFTGFNPSNLLLKEIKEVFGGKLQTIISGGAAINPDILEFFNGLGFLAVQGYGLTECSPMAALNPGKQSLARASSVGHLLPMMEVKIVDADSDGVGEICFKGQNVMLGYYDNPEETANVIIDGWFHTGDLGYVDKDNFIYITGRKKSVIIAPNGKNVYPEELEFILSESALIEESFVWPVNDENGQNKLIAATIKPDIAEIEALLGNGYSADELAEAIHKEIDRINVDLPAFKKINKVVVRTKDFDKTTAHKIKRFSEENRKN